MSNPNTELSTRPIQIAAVASGLLVILGLLFAYVAYEQTPKIQEIRVDGPSESYTESKTRHLFAPLFVPALIFFALLYHSIRWKRVSDSMMADYWSYQSQNPNIRLTYLKPLYRSVVFGFLLAAAICTGISVYRSATLLGLIS